MLLICLLLIGLIAYAIAIEDRHLSFKQIELAPIRVINKPVETKAIKVK